MSGRIAATFGQRVSHHPPTAVLPRMWRCLWRQDARSPVCPDTRVDGQTGLVTGGSRGIGLEISRGLGRRGAGVISAARGEQTGRRAARELGARFGHASHFVPLDLADLRTLPATLRALEDLLEGRRLDVVVANAGLWPLRHGLSAQGHEIAFATNVLGHHALIRGLRTRGLLAPGARIVIVTGDIYVMARACTPDYTYRGAFGGQLAYCRSKLGNLWQARELARRHPELRVHAVHPGVIASELGGPNTGLAGAVKRALMLSPERGAQTPLFCATQSDLASGTYLHNTLGRVELRPYDAAADGDAAAAVWEQLERLV